jgi:DNA replication regulator DPB11
LTKQITHLISFRTEGAKYKAARSWGLHTVSIEWLRDSLERGMILEEKLYDPTLPLEMRGEGAWDRTKPKRTSLGKRSREDSSGLEGGKRKLRRTASTKLSSQSAGIWGDIVGGGGVVPQVTRSGVWEAADDQVTAPIEQRKREPTVEVSRIETSDFTINPQPLIKGIFSGFRFYFEGFDLQKVQILTNHFVHHGAEIAETLDSLVSEQSERLLRLFRVVPSNLPMSEYSELPQSGVTVETVTEWWVERCLHQKTLIEPAEHVIGRPFPKFPIEGFHGITVSSAAFSGIDLLHVKKAVELLGGTYSEDMTPKSTILLIKSVDKLRKDKLEHAQLWNIPIVDAKWLWDSIRAGEKIPDQNYRCRSKKRTVSLPTPKSAEQGTTDKKTVERSRSELSQLSRSESQSINGPPPKLPRDSRLDTSAFTADEPILVKEEEESQCREPAANGSISTHDPSSRTEPLTEIDNNSPSRTVSTAPAPSDHPNPRPSAEISHAISSLLAKTKTAKQPDENDATGRKRSANRILGRAVSNVSTGSAFSRASSVDSTATHGRPVQYPSDFNNLSGNSNTTSGLTASEQIERFGNASKDRRGQMEEESQSSTQLQYDDPAGEEAKEEMLAKILGPKSDKGKNKRVMKERVVTLGDLAANTAAGPAKRAGGRTRKAVAGFK